MLYLVKICVVLTVLGAVSGAIGQKVVSNIEGAVVDRQSSYRLSLTWILIIWVLYLTPSHLLALCISGLVVLISSKAVASSPIQNYTFLVLTLPALNKRVPGIFGLDSFIYLNWPLILAVAILWCCRRNKRIYSLRGDTKIVLTTLILLMAIISFRGTSVTDGLRQMISITGILVLAVVIVLNSTGESPVMEFLIGIILAGILLGIIALFESTRGWLLFVELDSMYQINEFQFISPYKYRDGNLRAFTSLGNLQTGTIIGLSILAIFALRRQFENKTMFVLAFAILLGGLYSTHSRGPLFVSVLFMISTFLCQIFGVKSIILMVVLVTTILGLNSSVGIDWVTNLLGVSSDANYNYRVKLFSESLLVMLEYPLFGTEKFIQILAARGLVQGEGIVDVVNTYLQIGLGYGLVALVLVLFLQTISVVSAYRQVRVAEFEVDKAVQYSWLAFLAIIISYSLQISSVSVLGANGAFQVLLVVVAIASLQKRRKIIKGR